MRHPLSDIQSENIGAGTKIWQFVVVLPGAVIGKNCNICSHCFIENDVRVGNNVTIKNGVSLFDGVEIADNVFIGPNVITKNDIFPRSLGNWTNRFRKTLIKKGASVGANTTIICGNILNENCMVGAGSVVTSNIKANYLAYGNPAVHIKKI